EAPARSPSAQVREHRLGEVVSQVGGFIRATPRVRLAAMCQDVVSTGQAPAAGTSAKNVHDADPRNLGTLPTATGGLARHAYARARQAKVELGPLLRESGLTRQQIEDSEERINVRAQIRFLDLVAKALRDNSLGFHLAESAELRELGLLYYVAASSE